MDDRTRHLLGMRESPGMTHSQSNVDYVLFLEEDILTRIRIEEWIEQIINDDEDPRDYFISVMEDQHVFPPIWCENLFGKDDLTKD